MYAVNKKLEDEALTTLLGELEAHPLMTATDPSMLALKVAVTEALELRRILTAVDTRHFPEIVLVGDQEYTVCGSCWELVRTWDPVGEAASLALRPAWPCLDRLILHPEEAEPDDVD